MRVLYDGVAFENSYQRGIQRAFRELINHLPPDVQALLCLAERSKSSLPSRASVVRTVPVAMDLLPRSLRRALRPRLTGRARLRLAAECDVFHSTYYTLPPRPMPTVLHVHDLIPERFPHLFDSRWAQEEIERRRLAIEQATRIIAISSATAAEITRLYPSAGAKVTTIHWGAEHLPSTPCGPTARGRAALFVGDRKGYKNFALVLSALESAAWPVDVGLIVAGKAWTPDEDARIGRLGRQRSITHAGAASDAELARLYASAHCVVVPSLAEGFGFPVLEGQRAGIPVLCSDIPVFREVAGAGALFFDPSRPEELARRVAEAASPATRAALAHAAGDNLQRFSWQRCAEAVAQVYRAVCPPS